MAGSYYRMCSRCPSRPVIPEGARRCRVCRGREFTWYYHITYRDPASGRRKQIKKGGFATKGEAQAAGIKKLEKARSGQAVDPSKLTVREYLLDVWLPARRLEIGESTAINYEGAIRRHILDRIGDDRLQALKAPRLNWLYADVRDNGRIRGEGPLATGTVRKVHVVMHRALEDAVGWGMLEWNPATRANPPSATAALDEGRAKVRTWTAEQVGEFARAIAGHVLFALWLLAAATGMRREELLGLRWGDVDLERGRVAVRQVLIKVTGGAKLKPAPKTKHGRRTIRIPARVVEALRAHRTRQLEDRLAAGADWEDHDLVFARPTFGPHGEPPGRWWHPDYPTRVLRELIAASGLPPIRPFQDLRHSHASILLLAGEHTKVVQERLGHHSHHFTSDSYQHTIAAMDERAAESFDALAFSDREDEAGADGAP